MDTCASCLDRLLGGRLGLKHVWPYSLEEHPSCLRNSGVFPIGYRRRFNLEQTRHRVGSPKRVNDSNGFSIHDAAHGKANLTKCQGMTYQKFVRIV